MKHIYLIAIYIGMFNALLAQQVDVTKTFVQSPINTTLPDEIRAYTIVIPSTYNPAVPSPLILNLHAFYEPISDYRASLSIDSIAEANNVLVVYPLGDTCDWSAKPLFFLPDSGIGWNSGIIEGDFDDGAFINQVLDSVEHHYNVDTSHVFCMGASNGGFMTMKLGASSGERFTAMANIIGFDTLSPTGPVPMLSILGTKDTISRINGTPGVYPAWASVRTKWLNQNACNTSFTSDTLADLDPNDGSWVEKRTYDACGTRGAFVEYLIWDGGHNIPNTGVCTAPPIVCNALGSINNDFDPSVEIWNFFKQQATISLEEKASTATRVNVFPNPFKQNVYFDVHHLTRDYELKIFNLHGRLVHQQKLRPDDRAVNWNAKGHESSVYFYQISNQTEAISGKIELIR